MSRYRESILGFLRAVVKVFVIFAIVRLAFGVFAIAFLSDDGLAYSLRATAILALAVVVGLALALFVRSMGPSPRSRLTDDALPRTRLKRRLPFWRREFVGDIA